MIALPAEAVAARAVGWASIELDRAARELAHLLAPGSAFEGAPSSVILGARCRMGWAAISSGELRIVLLEPETEGRLAAFLARSGEGWVATWSLARGVRAQLPRLSVARPGPLGRERLALDAPVGGPYRLLVEAVPSPS